MSASPTQEIDTVVIGAGPAGLAVGACLQRAKVPFVVLERSAEVGTAWRNHYRRLHLHTAKRHSGLPYLPFPKTAPQYVPRTQVVEYLEGYAQKFALPVRFGEDVESVQRVDDRWLTRSSSGAWRSRSVVVCTGYNRVPKLPTWPGQQEFGGRILHSSAYLDGEPFRGQRVLVVGLGNSGGEIAIDLVEHGALPSLSVRSPVWVVPREFLGRPIQVSSILTARLPLAVKNLITRTVSKLSFGDLGKLGLRTPEKSIHTQVAELGRIPLLDVGTIDLIRAGKIAVEPNIDGFTRTGVRFEGGDVKPYDAVVLATGFTTGVEQFLEGHDKVLDALGVPKAANALSELPGLYFVGFQNSVTGLLRQIGIEAQSVAKAIAA